MEEAIKFLQNYMQKSDELFEEIGEELISKEVQNNIKILIKGIVENTPITVNSTESDVLKYLTDPKVIISQSFWAKFVEELELKNNMVNLMLADISEGAFYADDAAQCCEVRKGDCIGDENTTCADCLMEYYRNKAGGK